MRALPPQGIAPRSFLRDHWQKKPLLVRQAYPGFKGFVSKELLFSLAARTDAVSRIVVEHPRRRKGRWELHEGPFVDLNEGQLPKTSWTLLVQEIERLTPYGWDFLRAFDFLPLARVDDLMISYAAPGGSVGPHVDAYDVFLIQGEGRRRWQISTRGEQELDPHAPIKILKDFVPEQEWVLDPGDMLYLPPGVAHYGTAIDPCFTYSVGFVAPSHEALVQNFLVYMGQRLMASMPEDGIYTDPDLQPPRDVLQVGDDMVTSVARLFQNIRWTRNDVEDFLGRLLTGPKPHVVFETPVRPFTAASFARRLRGKGHVQLALSSRGLMKGPRAFLNGEAHALDARAAAVIHELFHDRAIALPLQASHDVEELLRGWHELGYLQISR